MMCCKSKWFGGLAALAVVLVGLGVLSGTDAGRWMAGTAWVQVQKVWDWTGKQVAPEDELKRIENEVVNLNKDIAVQFDKIVQHERAVEKDAKTVEADRKKVEEQWLVITALKKGVEEAQAAEQKFVVFGNKKSDLPTARTELTERWEAFKKAKAALDVKETTLKEKQETLTAMNDNMTAMVAAKDDYALQVESLKAKLEAAREKQARNQTETVDAGWKTRQTHIQESIDKIGDQIDSMTRLAVEHAKQIKTKADTGAAQAVKNDLTDEEIKKYEEGLNKLVIK